MRGLHLIMSGISVISALGCGVVNSAEQCLFLVLIPYILEEPALALMLLRSNDDYLSEFSRMDVREHYNHGLSFVRSICENFLLLEIMMCTMCNSSPCGLTSCLCSSASGDNDVYYVYF